LDRARRYLSILGALSGASLAFYLLVPLSLVFDMEFSIPVSAGIIVLTSAICTVVFYLAAPAITRAWMATLRLLENWVTKLSLQDIAVSAGGIIVGLIIANLLAPSLARIPIVGSVLPTIAMVILGYTGIIVARTKRDDLIALGSGKFRQLGRTGREQRVSIEKGTSLPFGKAAPKILDTSTIIDGRIIDICKSGFIEGTLIVPNFVLDELRRISDSSDNLRRNKGRRGLEALNVLQKEIPVSVQTWEWDTENDTDVDAILVKMGKITGGVIMTTDYNLARIAELQEVKVLNVNQLANALKLMVAPGDELLVEIIREGKQPGQGIGYLDDGTMIVVEQGKKHLNEGLWVTVTNVHSTQMGRMIFAKPRYMDKVMQSE
jgi:uncharacterized protein YacL